MVKTQKIEQWLPHIVNHRPWRPRGLRYALGGMRAYFDPVFVGLERLNKSKPALWVGNHTLYGLLDAPLLLLELYERHGLMVRSLGDRAHFQVPLWRDVLKRGGMVLGSPENCARLMRAGEHILVFPGGGREVMRRKGEAHRLIWKRRSGFARMALEHRYDIIPFASLGPDDSLDILLDANDVTGARLWRWSAEHTKLAELTRAGDMIPPIVRGLGPTPVPRPERFFFGFGERISADSYTAGADDPEAVWSLRERVAESIEVEMRALFELRGRDRPQWRQWRRWLT